MKLERIELIHIRIPLVGAFRTSFGKANDKDTNGEEHAAEVHEAGSAAATARRS